LAECLDGILRQVTDFPVEVIVHDDASTDGTARIIEAYAQNYPLMIQPVLQKTNQASRHKKIRAQLTSAFRGEFVAHCDGDDIWQDPYKLGKQVAFLREHPEYVLSYHASERVDETGRRLEDARRPKKHERDFTLAELRQLKWGSILLGTLVYRNVPIEFPPEYDLAPNGDHFLPILLAAYGGAKFLEDIEPLAYRQHDGGMWSRKSKEEQSHMYLRSYLQIAAYLVRIGEISSARKIIAGRLTQYMLNILEPSYRQLAGYCLLSGSIKPLKKRMARSLRRCLRKVV
jgi:glycosyltransferase involved in cell wall biosynthesis